MPTQTIVSTVRPHRTAYLVPAMDKNWIHSCLRLLDYCAQTWGGYGSIFIPTDGKTISPEFWRLLKSFDPDHIGLYQRTGRDIAEDEPVQFEKVLDRRVSAWEKQTGERKDYQVRAIREDLERSPAIDFQLEPALSEALKRQLNPFHFQEHVIDPTVFARSSPNYPDTKLEAVLPCLRVAPESVRYFDTEAPIAKLWAGTELGYACRQTQDLLRQAGLEIEVREVPNKELIPAIIQHTTGIKSSTRQRSLADATLYGLGIYGDRSIHEWELPTVVVFGKALEDYCFYQCLSRVRPRVIWLPPWLLDPTTHEDKEGLSDDFHFIAALRHAVGYSNEHNTEVVCTSLSLPEPELTSLMALVDQRSLLRDISWLARAPETVIPAYGLRLYDMNNAGYPQTILTDDTEVIPLFAPRTPKSLQNINPQTIRWISELKFPGRQIPNHPAMAGWMTDMLTNEARTSGNSLAFLNVRMFVNGHDDAESAGQRPSIRLPKAQTTFEFLAQNTGLDARPSDKGIYARTLIEKIGGLQATVDFLRSSVGRKLIHLYQSKEKGGIGIFLKDERRRYLAADSLTELCRDEQQAIELIDRFSRNSIFYRGFIFRCEFCRRAAWYNVGAISDQFICKRCHRSQTYTSHHWKNPAQPHWYHQLDEVILQALFHDCDVPILTLGALSNSSKDGFDYAAELEYREHGATDVWIESDLNCIASGQLIVGEAKKGNRIAKTAKEEHEVIGSYLALATRLHAPVVVFATAQDRWEPQTEQRIRDAFKQTWIVPRILTGKDLFE